MLTQRELNAVQAAVQAAVTRDLHGRCLRQNEAEADYDLLLAAEAKLKRVRILALRAANALRKGADALVDELMAAGAEEIRGHPTLAGHAKIEELLRRVEAEILDATRGKDEP